MTDAMAEGTILPVKVTPTTLHVEKLSYGFAPEAVDNIGSYLLTSVVPTQVRQKFLGSGERLHVKNIHDVSFRCEPGQITGIVGDRKSNRKALMDLICGHRKYGRFSGDLFLTTGNDSQQLSESHSKHLALEFEYFNSIAFIPRKSLHLVGLTYLELLEFSIKLKTVLSPKEARQRAMELLEFVDMKDKANYYIPDEVSPRGTVGSDLRRLTIAVSIIADNPVIILDDPFKNVDTIYAYHSLDIMKKLAARGHTVILSTSRVEPFMIDGLDSIVLLNEGRSIYSGKRSGLERHFSSSNLGYQVNRNDRMIGEFLLDISSGDEPSGTGTAIGSVELQKIFEASQFNTMKEKAEGRRILAYNEDGHPQRWKFSDSSTLYSVLYRTFVMAHRAFLCKIRETNILKKMLMANIILSLFVGCLMYGQGDFGTHINTNACINFMAPNIMNPTQMVPYDLGCLFPDLKVLNITGSMFLSISLAITFQVMNVHAVVRKILVAKYEQRNGYAPPFLFGVVMLFSEIVPAFFFQIIFTAIYVPLAFLTEGGDIDYGFFLQIMFMAVTVGITTALLLSSIFVRELLVRDVFLLLVLFELLLSTFVFNLNNRPEYIANLTKLNPTRWLIQSAMIWKYQNYPDAYTQLDSIGLVPIPGYLDSYGYFKNDYSFNDVFPYIRNFYYFSCTIFVIFLMPKISRLVRGVTGVDVTGRESSIPGEVTITDPNALRESIDTSFDTSSTKNAVHADNLEAVRNVLKAEEGPTVECRNLCYVVDTYKFPRGINRSHVLSDITATFEAGKLHAIVGPHGSGRSAFLHALAGDLHVQNARITGEVRHNGRVPDANLKGWERCGLVESSNIFYRDLSVKESLKYSVLLRLKGDTIDANEFVDSILALTNLKLCSGTKTKDLTKGEARLLSIAEELVAGKSLILIDEPTSNLSSKDSAKVMNVLKALIGLKYTIICAIHEPSTELFKALDNIVLLCRGMVMYQGEAKNAVSHFTSETWGFESKRNQTAWSFLADISAGHQLNKDGLELYAVHSQLGEKSADLVKSNAYEFAPTANPLQSNGDNSTGGGLNNYDSTSSISSGSFQIFDDKSSTRPIFDIERAKHSIEKGWLLLERSTKSVMRRPKLYVGALVLHLLVAILFGICIGSVKGYKNDTTAYFILSSVMLVFINIFYLFYLHKNKEVFLKEHSRGIYSYIAFWSFSSIPVYMLQVLSALLYGIVVYYWIGLNSHKERPLFYLMIIATISLIGNIICETVVFVVPSIRQCYHIFPAIVFLLYYFSNIPVKPSTYAVWMRNWVPDISVFRWTLEASLANEYDDYSSSAFQASDIYIYLDPAHPNNPIIFSQVPVNSPTATLLYSFDSYYFFKWILGFQSPSGTRGHCLAIMFLNVVIFRLISLIAMRFVSHGMRGRRHFYKSIGEYE